MLTVSASAANRIATNHQIIVAQLGARQNYTVPIALQNLNCLQRFYTDTYLSATEFDLARSLRQIRWFRNRLKHLKTCYSQALANDRVTRFRWLGWCYAKALDQANSHQEKYQHLLDYGAAFNRAILQRGLPDASHLYAVNHAAQQLFEQARSRGIRCVLEQIYPALYEEHLEQEEELRWRGWALLPRIPLYRSPTFQRWCEVQRAEWELAETIVVPSAYSQRAIATIAPTIQAKLRIVPPVVNLGAIEADSQPPQEREWSGARPLRVLFVGQVNLQNGIPYLLQAFQQLDPRLATLMIVGDQQLCPEKLAAVSDRVEFHPPTPGQLPQLFRAADILIMPSLSDRESAVILAALATGLPVIATDHCADFVQPGVNGLQIAIRRPNAIIDTIQQLTQQPDLLTHLSQGAIATSQQFTLLHYQAQLAQALQLAA
jgi:glycosyltransferase involved in cell wall biosynthesis